MDVKMPPRPHRPSSWMEPRPQEQRFGYRLMSFVGQQRHDRQQLSQGALQVASTQLPLVCDRRFPPPRVIFPLGAHARHAACPAALAFLRKGHDKSFAGRSGGVRLVEQPLDSRPIGGIHVAIADMSTVFEHCQRRPNGARAALPMMPAPAKWLHLFAVRGGNGSEGGDAVCRCE